GACLTSYELRTGRRAVGAGSGVRGGRRDPFPKSGDGSYASGWSPDEWGSERVPRGRLDPHAPPPPPPPARRQRRGNLDRSGMLREWPAFEALAKSFAEGEVCLRVAGLTGAARALAVAELLQTHPRPALVVVASMADAHRWTQDLKL